MRKNPSKGQAVVGMPLTIEERLDTTEKRLASIEARLELLGKLENQTADKIDALPTILGEAHDRDKATVDALAARVEELERCARG